MFSGLDQTKLLWIGIALLVLLGVAWLAIAMSSSRETLRGAELLLDRTEEERAADEDEDDTRAG